jgi:hypothetical protein
MDDGLPQLGHNAVSSWRFSSKQARHHHHGPRNPPSTHVAFSQPIALPTPPTHRTARYAAAAAAAAAAVGLSAARHSLTPPTRGILGGPRAFLRAVLSSPGRRGIAVCPRDPLRGASRPATVDAVLGRPSHHHHTTFRAVDATIRSIIACSFRRRRISPFPLPCPRCRLTSPFSQLLLC